jgi:hypothetical protein
MRTFAFIPILLVAASLAACGGSGEPQPPAAPAGGQVLSIEEALDSDLSGPLLVNGYLLADGNRVRLCEALAESYPPQCGGPSLEVIGLKLLEQRRLYKANGQVTWSEQPVQLLGVVEDGTITVSENAQS